MTLDESGANTAKDQQEQNTCRLLYISAVQTYASIQKNLTDHHHRPYMLVNHNHSYNYACVRTESIPYFHTTKSTTDAVGTRTVIEPSARRHHRTTSQIQGTVDGMVG